ncbi:hypothetical protein PF008_g14357 [Phytophthora fragariae]|uniref:Uncharacterized protein n=1 Tax=Phytophthora fragariae TaxID=53985 RepID=A0A6G0RIN6_9STRA|nr:hypothetical protein PF008_g14357 [Phytophthora fragariae]
MLRLNDFLDDFSADCTIADAYKRTNSVRLMQYVAAREDPDEMDPFYRRWLFNKTTEMAAARGDLQSLQWLVESYLPDEFLTKAVAAAAANGHLPVLEWLFERHRDRGYWGNTEMCGALTNGHVKVVEWLRTHAAPRSECLGEVMDAAVRAASLDTVKWLHDEHKVMSCATGSWDQPAKDGPLSFLKFLHAHSIGSPGDKVDGRSLEVPNSDWRFNEWSGKVNLRRARGNIANTCWICDSASLRLEQM